MTTINSAYRMNTQQVKSSVIETSTKHKEENFDSRPESPATRVTISEGAYQNYRFQQADPNEGLGKAFQKFLAEFNSEEAIEQRRLDQLEKQKELHPLENDFQIEGVHAVFPEGTLQHSIAMAVEGKVANASLYASQLAQAIRASISMADKSVEERAFYRETALQQAQYVAENYFDNEEDAASFLAEINQYADNDILREKGYIVIDNSDIKPFKELDKMDSLQLANLYMDKSQFAYFRHGTAEKAKEFQQMTDQYRNKMAAEFSVKEKEASGVINDIKSLISGITWDQDNYAETMDSLLQDAKYTEIAKWHQNMLKLFI